MADDIYMCMTDERERIELVSLKTEIERKEDENVRFDLIQGFVPRILFPFFESTFSLSKKIKL